MDIINISEKKMDNLALFYFHEGTSRRAHDFLGCHKEKDGFVFRVWAPNADYVSVVGDFNGWRENENPCRKISDKGVWEAHAEGKAGDRYKFFISKNSRSVLKADPFARLAETPPKTASVIYEWQDYEWSDGGWLDFRRNFTREKLGQMPINIYEVHLGSFKKGLSYRELADELIPYAKKMGYTHLELLPVTEYPFDASWGYQVTGYFAPTSRYGEPCDLMYFVDRAHSAGMGVILDWVPAHFPKDAHGLYEFDLSPLFEYQGRDRMEHEIWGTRRFDVGREEVQSFLISSAYHFIENYHFDGLRVDAVASMLYLDYDKKAGEWIPNVYGDNRCLEAICFFQKFNSFLAEDHPDVMTIAEESTAWGRVTGFDNAGLGFSLKWNMGWMNDTLSYASLDPVYRKYHHDRLTFSLTYAFSESFVLPISHDEVVHGKRSLIDKMSGGYEMKFLTARAILTYMYTHPGKKLVFMGTEIGQFREWDFAGEVEWFLLDYPAHKSFQEFSSSLSHFYLANPPLYERDGGWSGFEWCDPDNADESVISFIRRDGAGNELLVVINFTPVERRGFEVRVRDGVWQEVFSSSGERCEKYISKEGKMKVNLPSMTGIIYKMEGSKYE